MSEVRLYVDEDAGENAVVGGLRARGVDVLTTVEASRCGATDRDQLAFATQQGRSIYTFNVGDFGSLHAEHLRQASIMPASSAYLTNGAPWARRFADWRVFSAASQRKKWSTAWNTCRRRVPVIDREDGLVCHWLAQAVRSAGDRGRLLRDVDPVNMLDY